MARVLVRNIAKAGAVPARPQVLRRQLTQQASPLQETNAVREIHKLMAEVRGAHPQKLKLSMPSE